MKNAKICPFCGHSPSEYDKVAALVGLTAKERLEVANAIECAATGHPIQFKIRKAKRVWKKFFTR